MTPVKVFLYDLTGRPQDAEEWDTVETLQGWLACHREPYTSRTIVFDEIREEPVPGKTSVYPSHRVVRVEYDHSIAEKVKRLDDGS